ncbi:6-phosphofructokinase 3-like, partial [Trifolium medium]|nr:6-phosphofructokinase 3-like [Trifolium medium]
IEEAERAINAAHVEAESVQNGIGVVKLMGRYSGVQDLLHKENGHMGIVIAEGARQELHSENTNSKKNRMLLETNFFKMLGFGYPKV